ncbi:CD151 antigen isoform X2 [Agrilus planipennis]|uniref:Tetraspanin n=1 Tax=Agrilus planipennis TaxID=224129 RepID=A0A7F5QWG1_AGRPL|nr:CD151 antigen isoform X1 [Agrilus planipennis]XP_025829461.1 CD151 antigen isoform X2 [Agrilus planipennis]XP_025829462.1 CD151 antigen isoform X2 [Agrilus planipennis]XP_025829463.1 CD151 antigen isoform X2 [Agrilus planipennis]
MDKLIGRDEGCCTVNYLKQALHIFNVIFLLAGLGVLGVAIWTISDKYQYVTLLTTVTYEVLIYFLLFAGALVLLIAVIGCCAISKENRPMLICYIFALILIFLLEAMVGLMSYVYDEQLETELEMNLNNTFLTTYSIDETKTKAIDFLQMEFHCCGAVSFDDWKYSRWRTENLSGKNLVPDSCCKTILPECGKRDHPSNINYSGCLTKMAHHMKYHLFVLCAVGLGICVVQIIGIILSCKLYFKLRNVIDYD